MAAVTLTTYANVKEWLALQSDSDQNLIERLIVSASRMVLSYLNRPNIFYTLYNDTYDGQGGAQVQLREWPVVDVVSVMDGARNIPAKSNNAAYGAG